MGRAARWRWVGIGAAAAIAAAGYVRGRAAPLRPLQLTLSAVSLPADGFSTSRAVALHAGQRVDVELSVVSGARHAVADGVRVRSTVLPGEAVIEARAKNFRPARARLRTEAMWSDAAGDGTPDFLRLASASDRRAFRRWFTYLAEAQFYRAELPAEITDCAALLRFAYREALRDHDAAWLDAMRLPALPEAGDVERYRYPYTPLGASLFRVKPGPLDRDDVARGAFAEFADAQTLMRHNTHRVARDVERALPGDLLFYRQLEQQMPFHAMIVVGPAALEPAGERYLVYHTGPLGKEKGEIRRPSYDALLRHPQPRWRPLSGNPNFLGVYRWNILREVE